MSKIKTKEEWSQAWCRACDEGDIEEIQRLNGKEFELLKSSLYYDDGFSIACKKGYLEVIRELIKEEYLMGLEDQIRAAHSWGFVVACEHGHLDIVKFLTQSQEMKDLGLKWVRGDDYDQWGFEHACEQGHLETVKYLLDPPQKEGRKLWSIDVHGDGDAAFKKACRKGRLEIVKFLTTSEELKKMGHSWVDLSKRGDFYFLTACQSGSLEVVKFLTSSKELKEAGQNWLSVNGDSGFELVCEMGQLEIVKYLTAGEELKAAGLKGVKIQSYRGAGLKMAAKSGHLDIIKFAMESKGLIESEPSLYEKEWLRQEMFNKAAQFGKREVLEYLADRKEIREEGGRMNINAKGKAAWVMACEGGHLEVVKEMISQSKIKRRPMIDESNQEGLLRAINVKHWKVVEWLILECGVKKTNEIGLEMNANPQIQEWIRIREEKERFEEIFNSKGKVDRLQEQASQKTKRI